MKFRAVIMDKNKQKLGSVTFGTWAEAAAKLRDDRTAGRKYSSIIPESIVEDLREG